MRTAVVRIGVDMMGELTAEQLTSGMARLATLATEAGAELIDTDLTRLPPKRREVELLMQGTDAPTLQSMGADLCRRAFATEPVVGVLTFVSHGTDDDARGVLAGFGLTGEVERVPSGQGWDVITVTLPRSDLTRVPESRIHTALEASTNCEVRIVVRD